MSLGFPLSKIGTRIGGGGTSIELLMHDLGEALGAGRDRILMLGGGNPAAIPEVIDVWRRRMQELLDDDGPTFSRMLGDYDPPRGSPAFLEAMAGLLRREFGWDVTPDNLAVTAGGQTAFFLLFNLLAGDMPDGSRRKVLLPMAPEYIGYCDLGLTMPLFEARRPRIEHTGPHRFKYRVDFDSLDIGPDVALVCASRPTNPTGNVMTDDEVQRLAKRCREAGVPLVLDNAYGTPFPQILFREATPYWDDNTILTLSLSKLGLPGTRTAVVVAPPEIARSIQAMTSITGLANNNVGQAIITPLLESGEIIRLSRDVVQPFYKEKATHALKVAAATLPDSIDYHLHESEGALFLWLWLRGLPISSREFYERLKARGVLVLPGEFFFYGVGDEDWPHSRECIRISFSMDRETVERGFEIIADEAAKAYGR